MKMTQTKRGQKKMVNSSHMRNTKYRRTKNLVKKSVEISNQCSLDFVIIIYDKKFKRFKEVHTSRDLTLENVNNLLKMSTDSIDDSNSGAINDLSLPKYKRIYARDLITLEDEKQADYEPENVDEVKHNSEKMMDAEELLP